MGRKYVSMQEELAARKAAAGIEPAERANKKEPEKEALSAKFRGLLDKGSIKAKKQVRSRGHEGVPGMVEPKQVEEVPEEDVNIEPVEDADEFDGNESGNLSAGTAIVVIVGIIIAVIAMPLFFGGADYEEYDIGETYDGLMELSTYSTDEEVIEIVDEELSSYDETDSEALNDWIRDTNISELMGRDFKYWNATAGDKYLRVNARFGEDENYSTLCEEATSELQDALMDADLDETKVLFIVRNLENDDLMYVSIDNDGYMY